jgi:hypothetical protein
LQQNVARFCAPLSHHRPQQQAPTSANAIVRGRVLPMRLVTFLALLGLAVWFLWPQYLKWKQRRRFREFEDEARRKWERHKRE